jgi:hypothetical protein
MPNADQLLRVRVRQWLQQHTLDYAEDHSVGAYADGQGEERDGGKHGRTPESAHNLPELIDEHCHVPNLQGAFDCTVP